MKKESAVYAEHLLDLFTEIAHRVVTEQPLREIEAEITPSLAQGLQFLFQHECCSVRNVAEGLSMSFSAASQLVERLVKRGMVTRCEKAEDRRLSEIRVTEKGRDLVMQLRERRVAGMSRILDRMEDADRSALVANLEKFITAAIGDEKSALETCSHCGREHLSECVINAAYLGKAKY